MESSTVLREGEDYYLENGRWVFTSAYHLKRGYCCGSGCRHCPWRNEQKSGTPEISRPPTDSGKK
ncbi:MAG: hypothetical protein IT269_00625 [Saprospiraceae bacterium]|nr:hypothetical protein [Saprospiraceae bacterium]